MKSFAAIALLAFPGIAAAQEPARDVSITSGDATLSARVLDGVGEGARPAIVLFNGFPAGPNIPRIATDLQAAGYTVLLPQYRGTGSSGGTISLQHSREDGAASVAWLKEAAGNGVDAAKIGVIGVSYGGWVALQTAAADPDVRCAVALVPADMGVIGARWGADADYRSAWKTDLDSFAADPASTRFGPDGVDGFMNAITAGAESYRLAPRAAALADRPVFVAGGRRDPAAPFADHYVPLVEALRVAEAPFAALEFDGGHNPSEASAAAQGFIERSCFSA
ncbi:alpha/beta fold hydrolase [Brevundimonas sp.]|uniref:alpha/beta hydrolase family protein n=1 Tax=Brevundimonas sp. TaxID=1871086 RepID=UPI00286C0005|nr:alpha/beta fold hydrolase [Brevundimonas sp.]